MRAAKRRCFGAASFGAARLILWAPCSHAQDAMAHVPVDAAFAELGITPSAMIEHEAAMTVRSPMQRPLSDHSRRGGQLLGRRQTAVSLRREHWGGAALPALTRLLSLRGCRWMPASPQSTASAPECLSKISSCSTGLRAEPPHPSRSLPSIWGWVGHSGPLGASACAQSP